MNIFRSVWVSLISAVGFVLLFSYQLTELLGAYLVAWVGEACVAKDPWLGLIGRAFGTTTLSLFGVGAVLIPLELLGLGRFYQKGMGDTERWRRVVRRFLMISMCILSIISIVLLTVFCSRIT